MAQAPRLHSAASKFLGLVRGRRAVIDWGEVALSVAILAVGHPAERGELFEGARFEQLIWRCELRSAAVTFGAALRLPGGAGAAAARRSGQPLVEVQLVDEAYDEAAASALGLSRGQATVLVHTGSRGLGHQVCTDFLKTMDEVMARYGIVVPDRPLACAPLSSPEGQSYLRAMAAAANFGWGTPRSR